MGEGEPTGEQLHAAIGRIRVGATTDTAGTIRRHRSATHLKSTGGSTSS